MKSIRANRKVEPMLSVLPLLQSNWWWLPVCHRDILRDKDPNDKGILCCKSCLRCPVANFLVEGLWRVLEGSELSSKALHLDLGLQQPQDCVYHLRLLSRAFQSNPEQTGPGKFHLAWLAGTVPEKGWGDIPRACL